ncbi:hypothetical protein [Actinomycetospora chiangmaiensis]|nr:hypothetical protein [Actinomycetospora chiangmaiensis]
MTIPAVAGSFVGQLVHGFLGGMSGLVNRLPDQLPLPRRRP